MPHPARTCADYFGRIVKGVTTCQSDALATGVGDNREGAKSNRGGSLQIGMRM